MKGVRTRGGTLLYQSYTYLLPLKGYGLWAVLVVLKTLCPFWVGIGYGFQGTYGSVHVRTYLSFLILNE